MQCEHLYRQALKVANTGNAMEEQEIRQIIRCQEDRQRQQQINKAVHPPQGKSSLKVQLNDPNQTPTGYEQELHAESDIIHECNKCLGSRFQLGTHALARHGQLLQDLGTLGDTEAAECIPSGTYSFPKSYNPATILLLREVAHTHLVYATQPMAAEPIDLNNFIEYWRTAKEHTSFASSMDSS